MKNIAPGQAAVTALDTDREPSRAELDAIEEEMPLIVAELDLLEAQIVALDRVPNELDARRIRRARHEVLTARRDLANRSAEFPGVA